MSRGRDEIRESTFQDRGIQLPAPRPVEVREPGPLDRDRPGVSMDRLWLPARPEREVVTANGRTYRLRGSESELLATVGTFRVVREDDLAASRSGDPASASLEAELRHLGRDGLLDRRTIAITHTPERLVALTRAGQSLLEDHRDPSPDGRDQAYHAGWLNRKDLVHDAQLYRIFHAEARTIEADGGRVHRVVLDFEFRSEYQSFLHRPIAAAREHDAELFGQAHDLPVVDGHLQVPDLRIEYDVEGRLEHRDLELVTECYSRKSIAAKARAGFSLYRAGSGARV